MARRRRKEFPFNPNMKKHLNCDPHSLSCHQHPQLTRALAEPSTGHTVRARARGRATKPVPVPKLERDKARVNGKEPHYKLFYVSYTTGKVSGQKRESRSLAIDKHRLKDCQSAKICVQETKAKTKTAYIQHSEHSIM